MKTAQKLNADVVQSIMSDAGSLDRVKRYGLLGNIVTRLIFFDSHAEEKRIKGAKEGNTDDAIYLKTNYGLRVYTKEEIKKYERK